jgi:hypothetical protein
MAGVASLSPEGITSQEAQLLAPLAPASLSARAAGDGVLLSWALTGEDLTGFVCVRREQASSQWQVIARPGPTQTSFLDAQPRPGTYLYAVQAIGGNGKSSALTQSDPVQVG